MSKKKTHKITDFERTDAFSGPKKLEKHLKTSECYFNEDHMGSLANGTMTLTYN